MSYARPENGGIRVVDAPQWDHLTKATMISEGWYDYVPAPNDCPDGCKPIGERFEIDEVGYVISRFVTYAEKTAEDLVIEAAQEAARLQNELAELESKNTYHTNNPSPEGNAWIAANTARLVELRGA